PTVCLGGQAAGSSVSLRATILRVADTCHKDLKDTCQNLGTWGDLNWEQGVLRAGELMDAEVARFGSLGPMSGYAVLRPSDGGSGRISVNSEASACFFFLAVGGSPPIDCTDRLRALAGYFKQTDSCDPASPMVG